MARRAHDACRARRARSCAALCRTLERNSQAQGTPPRLRLRFCELTLRCNSTPACSATRSSRSRTSSSTMTNSRSVRPSRVRIVSCLIFLQSANKSMLQATRTVPPGTSTDSTFASASTGSWARRRSKASRRTMVRCARSGGGFTGSDDGEPGSPRTRPTATRLDPRAGCPVRKRLEPWCAHGAQYPERLCVYILFLGLADTYTAQTSS
jgi:hypothetical protein